MAFLVTTDLTLSINVASKIGSIPLISKKHTQFARASSKPKEQSKGFRWEELYASVVKEDSPEILVRLTKKHFINVLYV